MVKSIKNDLYFLKYVFNFSRAYVLGEAITAIINGLMPLLDIIMPKLLVDGFIYRISFRQIVFYIMVYVILQFTGSFITTFITERYINLNGHIYSMYFLFMINHKKTELGMAQLDDPEIHQKAALAEDIIYKGIGIDLIDNFFTAVTSIVSITATAIVLVHANAFLLFVILVFAVFSVISNLKMENWQLGQREENIYLTRVLNYYIDIMRDKSCTKEMRLYGFASWLVDKYNKTLEVLRIRLKKLYNKSLQITTIRIILENLKSNGIYLYLAWLAYKGKISIGGFSQYFNAASQFSESVLEFASFFMDLNINGKYISSFKDFMDLQPENYKEYSTINKEKFDKAVKAPLKLSMSNIDFKYKGMDRLVLNNINYTFEQGKVYVIAGENGAGKTTMVQLLSHLYNPCSGEILLNGVNINTFNDKDYKSLFSIVFQDFKYFAFTIGENVALDKYNRENQDTRQEIKKALKTAGLGKRVKSLEKGIDTNLGKIFYNDGVVLSGGENQKLAFARAVFHKPDILVLDEPSSALDPVAEDKLLRSFQEIAEDKIVIYISHRLSSAVLADEVLFLKDGKLCESGTHHELIKKNGEYARYYNTQAKYYTSCP
ncbi:MAG: ABC transporter ATP-binding protein [Lachnospiraceae bacterium]|nr:ABC transporter ATP-binding protein [Lachnospiraceae bacterium]